MDEHRLTQLFRDAADAAARDAPPARFDYADVLTGAHRARQRHRRLVTGAVAVAVLVTVGVGGAVAVSSASSSGPAGASNPLAQTAPSQPASPAPARPFLAVPEAARAPDVPANSCAAPDTRLFAELTAIRPELRDAPPKPISGEVRCPPGGRGFELDITEGGRSGTMRVLLAPKGGDSTARGRSGGSIATSSTSTPSGGTVTVSVVSSAGTDEGAPYANAVSHIAAELASKH